MTRRKKAVVLVGLALAAIGMIVGGWLFGLPAGINRRGFDRIQLGMSQREVEAILGGPPGDYPDPSYNSLDWGCIPLESINPQSDMSGCRSETWSARARSVTVYFRPDGAVADKGFLDFNMRASILERLRSHLGW